MTNGSIMRDAFQEFMPYYFGMINPIIHNEKNEHFKLNENQIKTLMCINHLGKVMPSVISKILNIQRGSLTTIIKSLVELKFIRKDYDPENERSYFLSLTDEGKSFVVYKRNKMGEEFEDLFDKLSLDKAKQIAQAFHLLSHYLESKGQPIR